MKSKLNDRLRELTVTVQAMCPACGERPAQDCGYGEWSYLMDGDEFDCTHPDAENLECPCRYTMCEECIKREEILDEVK